MDYERQGREDRREAHLAVAGTWVSLDGPVGLRGRVAKVRNANEDQIKVITLLSEIPGMFRGKKEDWELLPLAGADGVCPQILAAAIWEFQSWWKLAGLFKNIDGVVDPGGNTLKYLNFFAAAERYKAPGA